MGPLQRRHFEVAVGTLLDLCAVQGPVLHASWRGAGQAGWPAVSGAPPIAKTDSWCVQLGRRRGCRLSAGCLESHRRWEPQLLPPPYGSFLSR